MAKTKEQKSELLNKYRDALKDGASYILVDSDQVGSRQLTQLKKSLKENGANFIIVKNTLFKIAAQESDQPIEVQELLDSNGVIICGEDPTVAAKALVEVQKEYGNLNTKFAVLFGEYAGSDKVKDLASIPSREVLLSKLVGSMQAPLSGFVSVAQGNVRKLLTVLSEIQKNKK
ncbi:MAG: 50S ribosomal protein L10 [bacterium]